MFTEHVIEIFPGDINVNLLANGIIFKLVVVYNISNLRNKYVVQLEQ